MDDAEDELNNGAVEDNENPPEDDGGIAIFYKNLRVSWISLARATFQ